METVGKRAVLATFAAVLLFAAGVQVVAVGRPVSAAVFRFSAAGNFGSWPGFTESLRQLSTTGSDFAIALGDLSYGGESEAAWCQRFQRHFDNVALLAGNHDTGAPPLGEGDINAFARHCPFPLREPLVGEYAKQFYFDYPAGRPLARFILLSPDLVFVVDDGEQYSYDAGTPRYNWTRDAIDSARAAKIPWVIVAMHKNCIVASEHGCDIGPDLLNLLLDRRVDLILQGHTHHYARSHQLALSPGGCPAISPSTFQPGCISHHGADRRYVQGNGSVLVIAGIGGRDIRPFDAGDPDAGYFAAWQGDTPEGLGKGVVSFDVGVDRISAQTHVTGTFADAFTIVSPSRQASPVAAFLGILGVTGAAALGSAVAFVRVLRGRGASRTSEEPPPREPISP